ncbi:hypothetical protein A2U01_0035839, partial [Trifolium medium]|nr:hypothetical protein [Trifolium medium]
PFSVRYCSGGLAIVAVSPPPSHSIAVIV